MISSSKESQKILKELGEFLEECGFSTSVIPRGKEFPADTLMIEIYDAEEEENGKVMICNLLPLPEEEAEFTEYLHCYLQIPFNLKELDEGAVLKCINEMNKYTAIGHFVYMSDKKEPYVLYRANIPFESEEGIDLVAFSESIFLMNNYEESMEYLLVDLRDSGSAEEVIDKIAYLRR